MVEAVLEYFAGYKQIVKFNVMLGFLELSESAFQIFRNNYQPSKEYLTGKVPLTVKEIRRKYKVGELSDLFDQEVINEAEHKIFLDEQEFGE